MRLLPFLLPLLSLMLLQPSYADPGLTCYQCSNEEDPSTCNQTTVCGDSELCYVEENILTDWSVRFNVGCAHRATCDLVDTSYEVIGRRDLHLPMVTSPEETTRDRRNTLTKCFRCCDTPQCNDEACASLCRHDHCQNGGSCIARVGSVTGSCKCAPGYVGTHCQFEVDECSSSPCRNNGTCLDRVNGFTCTCPTGFTGSRCQTRAIISCLKCDGVEDPRNCTTESLCPDDDIHECYTEAYVSKGKILYRLGCRKKQECDVIRVKAVSIVDEHHVGRRTHDVRVCQGCCVENRCNRNICRQARGPMRSCKENLEYDAKPSGIYTLDLQDGGPPFQAYCDMDTDGGGWTVFQRRTHGSLSFRQNWTSYEHGFGNVRFEHWLGNALIHRLTSALGSGTHELRVELVDWHRHTAYAQYDHFAVGDASTNYTLTVSGYNGTAGDGMSHSSGHPFSTHDRYSSSEGRWCTRNYYGAWWYGGRDDCTAANLNARRGTLTQRGHIYMYWKPWMSMSSLRSSEMKLR